MWTFEYRHPTAAAAADIWSLWSDVPRWPEWDVDLEAVSLDGDFVAGTSGTLQPKGMDPFPFTIMRADPDRGYTDQTPLAGAVLRFDHEVVPGSAGNEIRQRVTVDGPDANRYFEELAGAIILDIPAALARLAEAAEAQAAGG